jgi:ligand-binding sensor domain-containing protein
MEWDGHNTITHPGLAASLGVPEDKIYNVFQDRSGTMWYCTEAGIQRRGPRTFAKFQPGLAARTPAYRTYEDPQGNIWVATKTGMYRVMADRLEGLSADIHARIFYVDKDGELWIGTNG